MGLRPFYCYFKAVDMRATVFMEKNKKVQVKIFFWQKILLILFGLLLTLVILEIGLRIGGFVLSSAQEYMNWLAIKQRGEYRIICVGESTTFMGYPAQLDDILNHSGSRIKFTVIDKGVPAINTNWIIDHLEKNLETYKPDMVIAMMGINDYGEHLPREAVATSKVTFLFQSLKTYKLIRFLWLHSLTKAKEVMFYKSNGDRLFPGNLIRIKLKEVFAEPVTKEDATKGATGSSFKKIDAYLKLGARELSRGKGNFSRAEDAFKKAIKIDPQNINAYIGLGWVYRHKLQAARAINAFKKALEINPVDVGSYEGLGWMYIELGEMSLAKEIFSKIISIAPKYTAAYNCLSWLLQSEGKHEQAEEQLQKAIALNPDRENSWRQLATLYLQGRKDDLAQQCFRKADQLRLNNPSYSVTSRNYLRMEEILNRRKVQLVCVQYPVRNIEPLRRIFDKYTNIIFVDNESTFKEALGQEGAKEYFIDMFGGDFGHCTNKGNRLLAENIANTILKEVFHK